MNDLPEFSQKVLQLPVVNRCYVQTIFCQMLTYSGLRTHYFILTWDRDLFSNLILVMQ